MASRLRLVGFVDPIADPDRASSSNPAAVESTEKGEGEAKRPEPPRREVTDLGSGSELVHVPRFASRETAWDWFDCLDKTIPWTRPLIRVFGRSSPQVRVLPRLLSVPCCHFLRHIRLGVLIIRDLDVLLQTPRDSCYVADEGLTDLKYSGHQPHAHSWDDFPVLKDILKVVHQALPGSYFNSLLLNRYKTGSDYVSWHADDEPLYGPTPEIASVSLGCEREFLLRKKPTKLQVVSGSGECTKRLKVTQQQHSFLLKHGSLLVMKGYTQRDWQHSVPKRAKASSPRINLTFRRVLT
ncbi:hypothetical protein EJB05_45212, partial [Eragrostis curvula]